MLASTFPLSWPARHSQSNLDSRMDKANGFEIHRKFIDEEMFIARIQKQYQFDPPNFFLLSPNTTFIGGYSQV